MVLYDEDPGDPKGKQYVGSVIWRTEPIKATGNQKPDIAVRADIEIPDRKFKMTMSFRRNTDSSLPASHTAELTFILPQDFSGGGVGNVPGILMKSNEQARGTPLAGLAVKVTDGFFLVGLSNVDSDRARNLQLLKERSWFDVPLVYANQRRAIIAIEKGAPGERAFNDAFAAWGEDPPSSSDQIAPVAQRVVLYDEDPADPKGKQYVGSVIWRTEPIKASGNQKPDIAVRADIEIPDRKFKMTMSFRRNTDTSLPASHTAELTFILPQDFSGGGVGNVPGILMKPNEQTRGTPLAGLAVKVTDGFFLVGLSNVDADRARNLQLLKERSWFDVPLVYANQRRAIIAIEKGAPGERAFNEAFAAWESELLHQQAPHLRQHNRRSTPQLASADAPMPPAFPKHSRRRSPRARRHLASRPLQRRRHLGADAAHDRPPQRWLSEGRRERRAARGVSTA